MPGWDETGWWVVDVSSWGMALMVGKEALVEEWRAHKSNWEQSTARKLRVRSITADEMDDLRSLKNFDPTDGHVPHDHLTPSDVIAVRDAVRANFQLATKPYRDKMKPFDTLVAFSSGALIPTPYQMQWLLLLAHKGLKSRERKLRHTSCVCCQVVLQPEVPVCEDCVGGQCEGDEGHKRSHLVDHYQHMADRM